MYLQYNCYFHDYKDHSKACLFVYQLRSVKMIRKYETKVLQLRECLKKNI